MGGTDDGIQLWGNVGVERVRRNHDGIIHPDSDWDCGPVVPLDRQTVERNVTEEVRQWKND